MSKLGFGSVLFACVAVCGVSAPASAALVVADYSGGVLFPTGVGNIFDGMNRNVAPYNLSGGSVIFDDALIPGAGTGTVNVALGTTNNDAFSFFAGTQLNRNRGDLISGGIAAIQFKNGVFNGFTFQSDFQTGGQYYRLEVNGGTWNINAFSDGQMVASGYVNIGRNGLTNIRPYAPPVGGVPEPAAWAMMISGFGLAGAAMRTRRRSVRFA